MPRPHPRQRLALLAAVLAGLAAPPPALAQPWPLQFNFGLGFNAPYQLCVELTDLQVRRAVAERGYHDIYLNVRNDRRIQVRATRGDWVYLLRVNTCTGRIVDQQRLRPA